MLISCNVIYLNTRFTLLMNFFQVGLSLLNEQYIWAEMPPFENSRMTEEEKQSWC